MSAGFLGAMAFVYLFFNVLDLAMAGLQIWLISETDYSFSR
jgi:hypothetical protein